MSAEPLFVFPVVSAWHRFSCSCNISDVSLAKNDTRHEVQPLKLLWYLSFILLHSTHCISHLARPVWAFALVWMKPLSWSTNTQCGHYVRELISDVFTVQCADVWNKVCSNIQPPLHIFVTHIWEPHIHDIIGTISADILDIRILLLPNICIGPDNLIWVRLWF